MSVFLCRQNPYGDKVKQRADTMESYVNQILSKRFLPIPYLHNLEVIKDIGLMPNLNKEQMLSVIEQATNHSLDSNKRKLHDKKTRIKNLLSASCPIVVIPWRKKWVIAKCNVQQPRIECMHNIMFKVNTSHDKVMFTTDDFTNASQGSKFEPCFALGVDITEYVLLDKPNIRLPPVSLQRIVNPDVLNIIYQHFK